MVRKSLSDTLSAEARRFLEEGKPRPSGESPRVDPKKWVPLSSGIDRLFSSAFWDEHERGELREHFLEMYRTVLEEAGLKVTSAGLLDPPKNYNPNTRALDKDIRSLRREVTVMAEVLRSVLQVVVKLGGCPPEQLRESLIEQSRKRRPEDFEAETSEPETSEPETFEEGTSRGSMRGVANGAPSTPVEQETNGAVEGRAPRAQVGNEGEPSGPEVEETVDSEVAASGLEADHGAPGVMPEASVMPEANGRGAAASAGVAGSSRESTDAPVEGPSIDEASTPEDPAPSAPFPETPELPDSRVPETPDESPKAGTEGSADEAPEDEVEEDGMSLSERLRRRPTKQASAAPEARPTGRPAAQTSARIAPQRAPGSRVDRDENGRIRRGGGRRPPLEPRVRNSPPKPKMASKACPRCSKEVPQRSPRCLSCGFRF